MPCSTTWLTSTSIACSRASGVTDTADNPLVHPIADRLPKVHGPRVVLLHQRRDALCTLMGEPRFDLGHQRTGDSLPSAIGMSRPPVDVAPPAVERPDDRADDSAPDLGHEDVCGAVGDGPPQVVGGVRHAGRGVGLPPKFEDALYIFQPART